MSTLDAHRETAFDPAAIERQILAAGIKRACVAASHLVTEANAAKHIASSHWSARELAERLYTWFWANFEVKQIDMTEADKQAVKSFLGHFCVAVAYSVAQPRIANTLADLEPEELAERMHRAFRERILQNSGETRQ